MKQQPKTEMFVVPRPGADMWVALFVMTGILSLFFYLEDLGDGGWPEFLESLAGTYGSTFICIVPSVAFWRHVLPRIVFRKLNFVTWILLHVGSGMIVSGLSAWLLSPVMFEVHPGMGKSPIRYAAISMVISGLFSTPMLIVFRNRSERRRVQEQLAEERQRRLEAQLHALQARTSPHFLFNTLNSIASLIPSNPDLAESTLERMSSLFRYSLESGAISAVPLSRELEAVEDYLTIQKTRFSDRFDWTIDVDPGLEGIHVPPLILQPLVENAVVHGVSRRLSGGIIAIRIFTGDENRVICDVRDNGSQVVGKHSAGSGTAVNDLRERLRLRYGERAQLETEPQEDGGFRSTVTLPRDAAA